MGEHATALRVAIAHAVDDLTAAPHDLTPARLSGPEYIDLITQVESLGRLVDGLRVRLAGDARTRSAGLVDTFGALGYATAVEALATLTGVSEATARSRMRTGEAVVPTVSMTGATIPPVFGAVADAMSEGTMGVEAAAVIVRELDAVSSRVEPGVLREAENGLVRLAAGSSGHPPLRVELVRDQAKAFVAVIDPDGARPKEELALRRRSLRFGRETIEGLIPVTGLLMGEVGAGLKRLVDAHRNKVAFVESPDPGAMGTSSNQTDILDVGLGSEATDDAVALDTVRDDRTLEQKRHDTLAAIISAASRVADAPELGGSAPAVTVTVIADALEDPNGVGFIDGHSTPLPVDTVDRFIDARGVQAVTITREGRILSLGSVQRCFTGTQRRAITARDGGCIIPGCTIPAGWCEIHHVIPHRDGGKTHTDNGVLLCWGHHRNIDTGPWRISMPGGVPHVRGPGHHQWTPATKARARPPHPRAG